MGRPEEGRRRQDHALHRRDAEREAGRELEGGRAVRRAQEVLLQEGPGQGREVPVQGEGRQQGRALGSVRAFAAHGLQGQKTYVAHTVFQQEFTPGMK